MIKITGKSNPSIKLLSKLSRAKGRAKENKFFIEGTRIIESALDLGRKPCFYVCNEEYGQTEAERRLLERLDERGVKGLCVDNRMFTELSDTTSSQGIIAVLDMNEVHIEEGDYELEDELVVVLDRLQDPGNMGTVIRTADACGVKTLIVIKGCVDIYNPKVLRSAMGSALAMRYIFTDTEESIELLSKKGYTTVATTPRTDMLYDEAEYTDKCALIIGNEGNGISDRLLEASDLSVKIPMWGSAESLNASVSAGIMMYEIKKYLKNLNGSA